MHKPNHLEQLQEKVEYGTTQLIAYNTIHTCLSCVVEKNTTVERPLVHQMTAFYLYYSPLSASFLFVSFARSSSLLPELSCDTWQNELK